jgi:hypothetical protein
VGNADRFGELGTFEREEETWGARRRRVDMEFICETEARPTSKKDSAKHKVRAGGLKENAMLSIQTVQS